MKKLNSPKFFFQFFKPRVIFDTSLLVANIDDRP